MDLLLLRHAEREKPCLGSDIDHPISKKGQADARALGAYLRTHLMPDQILHSPAKRVEQTLQALALSPSGTILKIPDLYQLHDPDVFVRTIHLFSEATTQRLLIIAHNDAISFFAALCGYDGRLLQAGQLVHFEVGSSWAGFDPEQCVFKGSRLPGASGLPQAHPAQAPG